MIEPKLAAEPMSTGLNPFDYEVFYHRLFSILAESRDLIRQLAFSQISREVGETAEGFYLPGGEVVLLSPGLLLHLNTVSRTIQYMIENRFRDDVGFNDGDQFICNDPMVAAMHRMDIALAAPFFYKGEHIGWVGNYSHTPEIGATEPGGHPMIATDCYHEGICLTPIKIVEGGKVRRELMEMLTRVVRDPRPIELDTKAKIAANERTKKNLTRLVDEVGVDFFLRASRQLIDDAERQSREIVKRRLPGKYRGRVFTDYKLPDRPGLRAVELELEICRDGTLVVRAPVVSPQAAGSYNCPLPCFEGNAFCLALGHLLYRTRWNTGVVRIFRTELPYGSMINCDETAAVHYGTVGTGLHSVTALTTILSRAAYLIDQHPDVMAPSGPVNQLLYGGIDQFGRRSGRYVMDCVSTGGGARLDKDGTDTGVHQINPWISCGDVEATEAAGPILQLGRRHTPDSGGFGKFRGGCATNTVLTFHNTPRMTLGNMAQGRYITAIQGLYGGYPPPASRFIKIHDAQLADAAQRGEPLAHEVRELFQYGRGRLEDLYCGSKYLPIREGDLVGTTYWGGAGLGDPLERDPDRIVRDLRNGATTLRAAREVYCLEVNPETLEVDREATRRNRERRNRERLARGRPAPEFLREVIRRRRERDLPAPVLEMFDELLQVPWAEGFRRELEYEEKIARGEIALERLELRGTRSRVLDLTPYVRVVEDEEGQRATICTVCGTVHGDARENFKLFCLVYERDPVEVHAEFAPDKEWMIYREFYCPGCGTQVEVEATPPGMPILHDVEIFELTGG